VCPPVLGTWTKTTRSGGSSSAAEARSLQVGQPAGERRLDLPKLGLDGREALGQDRLLPLQRDIGRRQAGNARTELARGGLHARSAGGKGTLLFLEIALQVRHPAGQPRMLNLDVSLMAGQPPERCVGRGLHAPEARHLALDRGYS
jgi:hypothetical protein